MDKILQRFSAILLDLNGTFMFGHDRFGADQDYPGTYHRLGGQSLDEGALRRAINACFEVLDRRYRDPAYFDCFPSVSAVLREISETSQLPAEERRLIEAVIAAHEVGDITEDYAQLLRGLARTHRLGLVSNIWSRKDVYLAELTRVGVLDLFDAVVFSSDGFRMKPSRAVFEQAVAALGAPAEAVVVIGDSLRCDVGGACAAGLASIWIDSQGKGTAPGGPQPNWVIRDLLELTAEPQRAQRDLRDLRDSAVNGPSA